MSVAVVFMSSIIPHVNTGWGPFTTGSKSYDSSDISVTHSNPASGVFSFWGVFENKSLQK
jgi:hypothetical protein